MSTVKQMEQVETKNDAPVYLQKVIIKYCGEVKKDSSASKSK